MMVRYQHCIDEDVHVKIEYSDNRGVATYPVMRLLKSSKDCYTPKLLPLLTYSNSRKINTHHLLEVNYLLDQKIVDLPHFRFLMG
jgi:hypothetical protein